MSVTSVKASVKEKSLMNPDEWFNEFVKGKYKISNDLSTAKFWSGVRNPTDTAGVGVPRPDINIAWLTVAAFFSLDHLFLRSPGTGFLKVITFGGLGLWWLWDLVQLFGERDRVLKYGMSAPFDFWTGIGQGMIYDGSTLKGDNKWQYEQKSSMGLWMLMLLVGFTGFDWIYLGKTWQGLRRLLIFVFAASIIAGLSVSVSKGIDGDGIVGFIFSAVSLGLVCLLVGSIWFSDLYTIFMSNDKLFKTGLPVPALIINLLGWPKKFFIENGVLKGSDEWVLLQMGITKDDSDWETKTKQWMIDNKEDYEKARRAYTRWQHINKFFMIDEDTMNGEFLKSLFKIQHSSEDKGKPQDQSGVGQSGGSHHDSHQSTQRYTSRGGAHHDSHQSTQRYTSRGGSHHDSHQSTQRYTSRGGSIRSAMEQGAKRLNQSNPLRRHAETNQINQNEEKDEDVAGIPPLDLAWQMGEIVYDQVSSIAYGILDAVAMTTPWGAAAKTAQLALKAAAKQGGIQLPSALTKGNPMAALRGIASSASQGIGAAVKKAGTEALSSVGESVQKAGTEALSSAVASAGVASDPKGLAGIAARVASDPKGLAGIAAKVASDPKGLAGIAARVASDPTGAAVTPQKGGGQAELSTEAQILGASVIAIIYGGTLKTLIDFLMSD